MGLEYSVTLLDIRVAGPKPDRCDDGTPPTVPSGLAVSHESDSSLTLIWESSTDDSGVVRYKIVRTSATSSFARAFSDVAEPTLLDTGLRANTQYCYQVTAVDGAGNESEPSSSVCGRTESQDAEPPSSPSMVSLDPLSPSVISVSWDAPADAMAVDRYVVYEWPESGASPTAIVETADLSADVTGLNPGTEYCFGVSAVDKAGNFSDISGMVCAMTPQADAAAWRLFIACAGRDYNFERPFDLDENRPTSVISVTGAGNDYNGTPLTYAITGTYNSQEMMLDGKIDWSFQEGGRRVDSFVADLSTDDTGAIPMNLVFHSRSGCNAVIRFVRGGDSRGNMAGVAFQSSSVGTPVGATFSGQ